MAAAVLCYCALRRVRDVAHMRHTRPWPYPLAPQYRANSGIAAFAARIGSTTFAIISDGQLAVRTPTETIDVGAPTYRYAATHGCCAVERVIVGSRRSATWSWLIHLPGGVGSEMF